MYNLARAAEAGWRGSVDDARDFELVADGGPADVARTVAPGRVAPKGGGHPRPTR
jgi:hypothetical protein